MSEAAKLREMMKDKAKRLATADPSKKVDASSWTPPEPLNADIKTGMRPLSRRAYKKGGKVAGEVKGECNPMRADRKARKAGGRTDEPTAYANAKVNRNLKDANQLREGKKHIGGFKRGGNPKGAEADPDMLNQITTEEYRRQLEKRQSTENGMPKASDLYDKEQLKRLERGYNKGGRSKKNVGGMLKMLSPIAMLADLAEDDKDKKRHGGRAKKQAGGMLNDPRTAGNAILQNSAMASGVPQDLLAFAPSMPSQGVKKFLGLKTGGKAKHPDEAMDKALIEKMVKKGALTAKAKGGMALDGTLQGTRPTGGRKAYKKGGAAKGKTDINIVIATGKPQGAMDAPMPPMPPPGGPAAPPPMGGAPGLPPMPPPPPMGGPGPGPAPMMRKAGGKVYRSYKDMDAGAGSGLGRLEKTEIAKRTAHKAGGKVYRSYKDMDAGAGSGLGRLEKTEIQSHKRGS